MKSEIPGERNFTPFTVILFVVLIVIPLAIYLTTPPPEGRLDVFDLWGGDCPRRAKAAMLFARAADSGKLGAAFFAMSETSDVNVSAPIAALFDNYTLKMDKKQVLKFYEAVAKKIPPGKGYRARLEKALDDAGDPKRRARALFALAVMKPPGLAEILDKAAKDDAPDVRYKAVLLLSSMEVPGARDRLLALLDDEDEVVRGAAGKALLDRWEKEVSARFLEELRYTDGDVRGRAARRLRALYGKNFGFDPWADEKKRNKAAGLWEEEVKSRQTKPAGTR